MAKQLAPIYPPLDSSIHLSHLIDFHIENNPDLPAIVYADTPSHITEISFLELGRAAHRAGHFIRPDRFGPESEVVALIANLDIILYQTLVLGMMRAGVVVGAPHRLVLSFSQSLHPAFCHVSTKHKRSSCIFAHQSRMPSYPNNEVFTWEPNGGSSSKRSRGLSFNHRRSTDSDAMLSCAWPRNHRASVHRVFSFNRHAELR